MYNGIGVQTPRGTGTSGYIETSLVSLKPPPMRAPKTQKLVAKQSKSLEDHNRRRRIELSCIKLRQKLEKSKMTKEDIDAAIKKYRKKLLNPNPTNADNKGDERQNNSNESEENQQQAELSDNED
ncbi:hypothetical protein M9Y10_022542 [Tritrichomonas musculus]|uniref:CWF21 domain-containing protein n=1 Tax=Tritrichomonas musculus TaxID=1915356 RepID=A0ABR2KVW1_9EUKA